MNKKNLTIIFIIITTVTLAFLCAIVVICQFHHRTSELMPVKQYYGHDGLYKYSDGVYYVSSTIEENCLWVYSLKDYTNSTYITPLEIEGKKVTAFLETAIEGNNTIQTLIFSDNIRDIDFSLYYEFETLQTVFIGAGVEHIMTGCFFNCPNLEQVVIDLRNPFYYSENNCVIRKNDRSIQITSPGMKSFPSSAKRINGNSFLNSKYKCLEIPPTVEEIDDLAFQNCMDLSAVFIPKTVNRIGKNIFYCSFGAKEASHINIFCENDRKPTEWSDDWYYVVQYGNSDGNNKEQYRDLNDKYVTIHWGATLEEYYEFINSSEN